MKSSSFRKDKPILFLTGCALGAACFLWVYGARILNPVYDAWISVEDDNAAPPQGESFREFRERVSAGWEKLSGYHQIKELSHRHSKLPAHSVIACHGGVIGALMMQLFPEKNLNMYGWIPDPGHGYTIIMEGGKAVGYRGF